METDALCPMCTRLNLLNKEENGIFFLTRKGLGQGDPLSDLLLNLIVDVFSRMLLKGSQASLIRGLCPNLVSRVEGGHAPAIWRHTLLFWRMAIEYLLDLSGFWLVFRLYLSLKLISISLISFTLMLMSLKLNIFPNISL